MALSLMFALSLVIGARSQNCQSSVATGVVAPSLLQAHQASRSKGSIATIAATSAGINPSGAAAPLDQSGYGAVADRCCQAEMQQFIERHIIDLGLEVCEQAGVRGITPYHSCGLGPQTFAALTANLLSDTAKRCTWIATVGNCNPMPEDCERWPDVPPLADCGCNRSNAAKMDMFSARVVSNNLGGAGPTSTDPPELRYTVGTSPTGQNFDVVVTAATYGATRSDINGKNGGFGLIAMNMGTQTDFKFSFMSPGTNTPVTLKEVHFAMFDLDGAPAAGLEYASSKGYHGYVTDANPNILASLSPDGRTAFRSPGVPNVPSPRIPSALTLEQRRHSVMYFFTDVSSFELQWGSESSGLTGTRLLFFAFESALDDRCGE